MNEESSKFVDKLAMEKLIKDKLTKVEHSPDKSYFKNQDISFDRIDKNTLSKLDIEYDEGVNGVSHYKIPSFYQQQFYSKNNQISIYFHPASNPQSNILLIHGLFDNNLANYLFFIKQLNELNFNVFFMVLPYHFNRKPDESYFGGEYFFSADLYRTRNAFKQAVLDIEASIQFISFQNTMPTGVLGFSMGGCVVFQYYLLKKGKVKTFLINPVTELKRLAWDNSLLRSVGTNLKKSSLNQDEIMKILIEIDPYEQIGQEFKADNLAMVYSTFDQFIEKSKYDSFIKKTGIRNVIEYSAGHLNVFRVPRLASDIQRFLND